MGLFDLGRKKRGKLLDLTDRYKKQQEKAAQMKAEMQSADSNAPSAGFDFLKNLASSSGPEQSSADYLSVSDSIDERRRKLAKRLLDVTNKIEDLTNQIYHLQQRVEVLEKKIKVGGY